MNKVTSLNKIKWSVFLSTKNKNLSIFTQCVEKLATSIDPKRTEVFYLGEQQDIFVSTFSHVMEKNNIPYFYADDEANALEMSKGEYVLFLTDHTIIPKNMLVRLTYNLENSVKDKKGYITSPVSNEVASDLNITPFNIDALQVALVKQDLKCTYTLALSLFCLLARREILKSDQTGREKILQANYDGGITVSSRDTIVFHYPEEIDDEISTKFITQEPKLGILYRVKLEDTLLLNKFVNSLKISLSITDNVYVLDDNSKVKLGIFMKDNYPDLWDKVKKYQKFSRPFDERRDFNDLISWAEEDDCNWILCLEGDEVLEDKVTKEYISKLINPYNPEIFGYSVTHYHFWNSETQWRMDKPWGQMSDVRLSRLFKGKRITKEGLVAGLCGYVPAMPEDTTRSTSIRIKNYGYITSELCLKKQEFYDKLALKHNGRLLDFSHLTKGNGIYRHDWVENNTITFYTPVKFGGAVLWDWLDTNAYFADEILIGNDRNQLPQEDLELISFYPNVRVVPTNMEDNFSVGRNMIIKEATTDWIYQLDVDESLDDLIAMRRLIDVKDVDAWMFSIANFQRDGGTIITDTIRLFRNKGEIKYWGRLHETVDKFINSSAWKVSKFPAMMHHIGYTLQTDNEAYQKMQRYLAINLTQIKENPMDGMAYYNTALHFLEDDLITEGIRLLEISSFLNPSFPLSGVEVAKTYIKKAAMWLDSSLKRLPNDSTVKKSLVPLGRKLNEIMPKNHLIAPGHCRSYFNVHADEGEWLRKHMFEMEQKMEQARIKAYQKR